MRLLPWCCVKLINPRREVAGVAIQEKEVSLQDFAREKQLIFLEHNPQQKLHTLVEAK